MNPLDHTSTRRDVLRTGGIVLSLGAVLAACGSGRSGSGDPGRLGVAPPPATLPKVEVDDVVLLRTAQSLEHTVLAIHEEALANGGLSADERTLVERLIADHSAHAEALGALITANGGEPFDCINPFMLDRAVTPVIEQIADSDDAHRDVLNAAEAFESWAGASYQAMVPMLKNGDLRRAIATLGGEQCRHATVLARVINPDETFAPTFFGESIEKDADGFVVPYAIPSVFGQVAGIELVVGAQSEEGTRFSITLQTPAANSFVYPHQSC